MNPKHFAKSVLAVAITTVLAGCMSENQGQTTADAGQPTTQNYGVLNALYSTREVGSTPPCTNGGVEVESGIDLNKNGVLDGEEATTHLICFGEDGLDAISPSVTVEDATPTDCPNSPEDNLGQVLVVNDQRLPMCNVTSIQALPNSPDYAKAQALVDGFGTWITSLEALGTSVEAYASELEANSANLAMLYEGGMDASVKGLGMMVMALAYLVEDIESGTNATAEIESLSDLIKLAMGDEEYFNYIVNSIDGPIPTYVAATKTFDLGTGNYTFSLNSDGGFDPYLETETPQTAPVEDALPLTSVSIGSITLPVADGKTFNFAMTGVSSSNDKAEISIPSLTASLTTTNSITNLYADGEENPGEMTMSFAMGSETAPMVIKNKPDMTVEGAEADLVQFSGFASAEGLVYFLSVPNVPDAKAEFLNPKTIAFNGELQQADKTLKVDLAFDMLNADTYRYSLDNVQGLDQINENGVIETFKTISVETLNPANFYHSNTGTILWVNRVKAVSFNGEKIGRLFYALDTNSDQVADSYRYTDQFSDGYLSSYGSSNTLATLLTSSSELNYLATGNNYINYSDDVSGNRNYWMDGYGIGLKINESDYYYDQLRAEGRLTVNINDLASLIENGGEPMVLSLPIDWLDLKSLEEQRPTYDFHRKYAARAGVVLSGLTDIEGNPIGDVKLDIEANRNGSLLSSGGLTFTMSYGDETSPQKFTARYFHPDMLAKTYWSSSNYRMRQFIFEDGQGGKISFDNVESYSDNPESCWDGSGIECSLSHVPYRSDIYYNHLIHGRLLMDYNTGDWLASFNNATETRVYKAR